jgi:hypothetical protein
MMAEFFFSIHLNPVLQIEGSQLTQRCDRFSIRHILINEGVRLVSVTHELSSEIATAILARAEETRKLKELKEVVLRVHDVLQELTEQCRRQNRRRLARRRCA